MFTNLSFSCTTTEELQQQAGVFKRNANELKNKMWWKNMKVSPYIYCSIYVTVAYDSLFVLSLI